MTSPIPDIGRLFALDPLKLTRDDLTAIVADLRSRRASFNLGARTTKAPTISEKTKKIIGDLDASGFEL